MASAMKMSPMILLLGLLLAIFVGYLVGRSRGQVVEKFKSGGDSACNKCGKSKPCGCPPMVIDLKVPDVPEYPSAAAASGVCNTCYKPKPCGCSSRDEMPYAKRERCPPCPVSYTHLTLPTNREV